MKKSLFIFGLLFLSIFSFAQVEFTTSGTYIVPPGVYEINAELVGAGGTGYGNGGAGGNGGGYSYGTFAVTPGQSIAITVGQPAPASKNTEIPSLGIKATGGFNAVSYNNGGVGSTVGVGSGGTINRSGGFGGLGEPYQYGGGGGGAGGPLADGGDGGYPGPPPAPNPGGAGGIGGGFPGGNGGNGAGSDGGVNPANSGTNYGGGGGGGNGSSSPASVGGPGIVRITIGGDAITSIAVTTLGSVPAVINTANGTLQTEVTILPATAYQNVTWSITTVTGNASIDQNGLVTALADGTVWVKATSLQSNSIADSLLVTISNQVPFLPWIEDFESGIGDWQTTFITTHVNKWAVGSATSNPGGGNSLYVSKDDGTTYEYNVSGTLVMHAYHDVLFSNAQNNFMLKFDWKGRGEGFSSTKYDYFKVWLVPDSYTPTAGTNTLITASTDRIQIGEFFNNSSTWLTYSAELNAATFSNKSYRIVFEWKQDGSTGYQGPAAIDNLSIVEISCPKPLGLTLAGSTTTTATVSWNSQSSAGDGFDYYFSTTATAPTSSTTPTDTALSNSKDLSGLVANTTYYFWVRANCGVGDGKSEWSSALQFKTLEFDPAVVPWTDDFSTNGQDWKLLRRSSSGNNKSNWFFGEATGSTIGSPGNVPDPPSLYITNTLSTSNPMNPNSMTDYSGSLYTWAIRDVQFPAGTNDFVLKFDWKSAGFNTISGTVKTAYLSVWLVPVSYEPTYYKMTAANTGGVQVAGPLYQSPNNWVNEEITLPNNLYAGGTHRLIFEWNKEQNVSSTSPITPPAAVDNIKITEKCPVTLTTDVQVCSGEQALLEVTSATPGVTFNWYTASTGGTAFHTGASYLTPAIIFPFSTTLYVSSSLGTCEGERKAITASALNAAPTVTSADEGRCGAGEVTFTATSTPSGADIKWYDDIVAGNLLHTGSSYTVSLAATTSFYVSGAMSSCEGAREQVTGTVAPQPLADAIIVTENASNNFSFSLSNPSNVDSFKWDFGDGSPLYTTNTNYDVTHQFTGPIGSPYIVSVTLINGGCETVMYTNTITLPVEMDKLTGVLNAKGHAALSWHTFMERNNKGFQIEKSLDGKQFDAIDFVSSKYEDGNGSQQTAYNYVENIPLTKTAYYRLLQLDQDDKISISNIVQITKEGKSLFAIKAYPNPIEHSVRISIDGERSENSYLIITDVLGNELSRMTVSTNEVEVNMAAYASGIYLIKYMDSDHVTVLRVNKK